MNAKRIKTVLLICVGMIFILSTISFSPALLVNIPAGMLAEQGITFTAKRYRMNALGTIRYDSLVLTDSAERSLRIASLRIESSLPDLLLLQRNVSGGMENPASLSRRFDKLRISGISGEIPFIDSAALNDAGLRLHATQKGAQGEFRFDSGAWKNFTFGGGRGDLSLRKEGLYLDTAQISLAGGTAGAAASVNPDGDSLRAHISVQGVSLPRLLKEPRLTGELALDFTLHPIHIKRLGNPYRPAGQGNIRIESFSDSGYPMLKKARHE
ncbi:MAG: hypothetical protein ACQEQV_10730, partial [Fibrobacterota bacterium]